MVQELIDNPKLMNKETLYELRSLVAAYPYYQTARLLMLKNLYLLHDPTFDEELRRAALFLTDRTKLFELVEARHHVLDSSASVHNGLAVEPQSPHTQSPIPGHIMTESSGASKTSRSERSASLIDRFLNQIPKESPAAPSNKPTAADATIDYVSFLLRSEQSQPPASQSSIATSSVAQPPVLSHSTAEPPATNRTTTLIDTFLNKGGRITLPEITAEEENAIVDAIKLVEEKDIPQFIQPDNSKTNTAKNPPQNTENAEISEDLAQKYIKQGNYLAAKDIILQLNLNNSEKSVYFADQIRFIDKIITLTKQNKNN